MNGEEDGLEDSAEVRALKARLQELRDEHRALDAAIVALHEMVTPEALQLARLKKRKLAIRDQMQWIEDQLMPDIIA